ncbi:probable galactose-1-phosphate uridylyltransferase [Cimex lectularius]|uniref:Galactose-1-phosphate uridylyltransferase n=1 Tax=Cimex lectularius TaxID=79782 RepID=A0A8I6TFI3_CIMLE|nr:probable galactose-1-phosphate uridylyltransferase [Cimex lectularius]
MEVTAAEFSLSAHPHIRWNPLIEKWVLVSPHRIERPWSGKEEKYEGQSLPETDPANPLVPQAMRPNGIVTPNYTNTYVFTNDFPALIPEPPEPPYNNDPLFKISAARGTCRVLCYAPKTEVTMGIMPIQDIFKIINIWVDETVDLGETYDWVQIFENRGELMGCSNPHPHGQIWASSFIPSEPALKDKTQREYYISNRTPMLMDYVRKEIENKERIVLMNDEWVVLVPFWASWPFETMILPRTHVQRMYDINHDQKVALAYIMRQLCVKYDNLFRSVFPFSMGWHGAPTGSKRSENMEHWVLHALFYPPLLRSASIRKFMVGYEMLAQAQRDMTPEAAAEKLRSASDSHFLFSDTK